MIESNDSNFNGNSTLSYDRGSPKFNDIHICKNVANHDVNIFFRYLNRISKTLRVFNLYTTIFFRLQIDDF